MKRTWVVIAVVVLASTLGAATQAGESDCPVTVAGSDEPGQELANVVGAQESVVARELERRGFKATLANASDPAERATVVATELDRIDARLAGLEACRAALVEAREAGDLTSKEYRRQVGTLESQIEDVGERLDRAETAASDLTERLRERKDVDERRFESLAERVDELESFVARPGRAVEPADASEDDAPTPPVRSDTPTEPTRDETPTEPPRDDAPTEQPPETHPTTTTPAVGDTPDEETTTTVTTTEPDGTEKPQDTGTPEPDEEDGKGVNFG